MVTDRYPGLTPPRAPGHEGVGHSEAMGAGASRVEHRATSRSKPGRKRAGSSSVRIACAVREIVRAVVTPLTESDTALN